MNYKNLKKTELIKTDSRRNVGPKLFEKIGSIIKNLLVYPQIPSPKLVLQVLVNLQETDNVSFI